MVIIDTRDNPETPERTILGYDLFRTCLACPQQYDVYLNDKEVGYLRLRHGSFRADCPYGTTVYYTEDSKGDGIFEEDEEEFFLTEAIKAIHAHLNP